MTEPKNPHDAFFKHFMTKPEIAADFLRQHLPPEVLAETDLSALVLQKDTFVDEALREHFSDLIYQAPWKAGGVIHIYLLFDHKSYVDGWVLLQLLRYKVFIWEKDKLTAGVLTPVIPLVVYHGATQWTAHPFFSII